MRVFLKCVAEAIAENGLKGLAAMVPGGAFACAVASSALKKYRERKKDAEIRAEFQQLAAASFEDARRIAADVAREVVALGPIEDRLELELYLSQVPGTVRQSLKRPEDVTGKTVPAGFGLKNPDDVLRILPGHALRFRPGNTIEGLPEWILVKPLGAGGFGEVWLARCKTNAADCGAVKFSRAEYAHLLQHERALIDRVMKAKKHDHIVKLKKAHLEAEIPWLMYEYVEGGNLVALVRKWQKLEEHKRIRQAQTALKQIADAVAHFHRQTPPIVHRDLKPENILVDKVHGRLLVTDFGIGAVTTNAAVIRDDGGTTTRFGRFPDTLRGVHTPLYASPQQRGGAAPGTRDDVYALGVIAYQLLTGQLEHGPGTDFGHDLRELGVQTTLIDLIGDCVSLKPERRPANGVVFLRRAMSTVTEPQSSAQPSTLALGASVGHTPTAVPSPASGQQPAPRTGYVRCSCCNQPISVTADDIGLTVTCPRTRKLIPVREADVRGVTLPTVARPIASVPTVPALHATESVPPSGRASDSHAESLSPKPVQPRPGSDPRVVEYEPDLVPPALLPAHDARAKQPQESQAASGPAYEVVEDSDQEDPHAEYTAWLNARLPEHAVGWNRLMKEQAERQRQQAPSKADYDQRQARAKMKAEDALRQAQERVKAEDNLREARSRMHECQNAVQVLGRRINQVARDGLEFIDAALQVTSASSECWYVKGMLLTWGLGEHGRALKCLKRALELEPDSIVLRQAIRDVKQWQARDDR